MNDIQKEIKRLSNLVQNRNKDKSSLEGQARINVWKKQINIKSKFENIEEQNLAEDNLDAYLNNYVFQDFSDVQNVADLVYEEILKNRLQKEIDSIVNNEKTKFVPDKLIDSLHSIESRIWELKEKVGITGKKEQDDLSALEEQKKKFKLHIAFNRNEFTFWSPFICKKCGAKDAIPTLMRRRVKNFDALKHPMFSGRFYFNRRGIELVKHSIWTKEEYAFVFNTVVKYVDWCIENEIKIIEIDGVEEAEIEKFINERPYLKKENVPEKILNNKGK